MLRALRHRRRPAAATGAPGIDLTPYDGLALHVRRGMGERTGDRRFPGRPEASGIELESYSAYAPGDDLRHLDWNAYGRNSSTSIPDGCGRPGTRRSPTRSPIPWRAVSVRRRQTWAARATASAAVHVMHAVRAPPRGRPR